jgi:hypothetical protein
MGFEMNKTQQYKLPSVRKFDSKRFLKKVKELREVMLTNDPKRFDDDDNVSK